MITKEAAIKELWYRGNLHFKIKHRDIQNRIEDKYNEIRARGGMLFVCNIARRSGKTFWAAKKATEICLNEAIDRPVVKYGSAFYEDLRKFIYPTFEKLLSDSPNSFPKEAIESRKVLEFHANTARIDFAGLDLKPNSLRGDYADLVIIEEAGFVSKLKYIYDSVCVPMTMYRDGAMIVMIGTPGEDINHDFMTTFKKKAIQENAYLELTIDDNDALTQSQRFFYLNECIDESTKLREYYCKVVVDESRAIIPEWKPEFVKEINKDELFQFYHKYESMDLGVIDKTVALYGYYDFKEAKLKILNELVMNGPEMTTAVLAEALKKKSLETWGDKVIYKRVSDNNNLLLLNDLSHEFKIRFSPISKDSLHAMVNKVRTWVAQNRIEVSPNCTELIGCLEGGIWDKNRREFLRSESYGHYDALASLIYLVRVINEQTNPIPALYKISSQTHHIPHDIVKNKNASELRKLIK